MEGAGDSSTRRDSSRGSVRPRADPRAWWYGLAIAFGLLVLPLVAWFVFPSVTHGPTVASASDVEEEETLDQEEPEPAEPDEAPRTTKTADLPTPSVSARLSGTVVDGEGNAVAEASIVCAHDPELKAVTDASGTFSLPAAAIDCSATASHPDHGTSSAVTLQSGSKNRIEMASPGRITGTVVDERGKAFPSFNIGIESFVSVSGDRDGGAFTPKRFTDPSGSFELDDLAPGTYVLSATTEGRPPAKSRTVTVTSGQRSRGVQIVVSNGTTLSGVVTDRETGQPLEGVRVRLDAAIFGASTQPVTTDSSGRYKLTGVPSGSFSARFSHLDFKDRIISLDGSTGPVRGDVDLAKKGDGPDMEMTGIGATLIQGDQLVEVGSILPGGPAEAAGVEPGDRIERIDGKSASSFTVNDCVQKLRGPEGTKVSVTLGRGDRTVAVTITRALIER